MKLFQVDEVMSVVVVAADKKDASRVANECDWGDPDRRQMEPKEVKSLKDLPDDAWVDAIPIGRRDDNPDELSCMDILEGRLGQGKKRHRIVMDVWIEPGEENKIKEFQTAVRSAATQAGIETETKS